jgi:hypothetical protein
MLESRNISTTLSVETLGVAAARGCSQGRVLSPLLWSLVVDDLWGLNSNGYYTVGYADDIAILINGKFLHTVPEVLQTALRTVQKWCERTNLSINPNKMVIIPFTRKRDIKGLKEPILFSKTIQICSEVKDLGITLDKGLTWKKTAINKAYKAYKWLYRSMHFTFQTTWRRESSSCPHCFTPEEKCLATHWMGKIPVKVLTQL